MKLKDYIFLYLVYTFLSVKVQNSEGKQLCSTLYSKSRNLGNNLKLDNGQRVDHLYAQTNWESTRSLTVENDCSLLICENPELGEPCETFGYGSHPLTSNGDISVECNCGVGSTLQWDRKYLKKSLCARVFLKGGKDYHLDLPISNQYFPKKWKDAVQTVLLRKGCEIAMFSESNLQGDAVILKTEITESFRRSIGSYRCDCEDSEFKGRNRTRPLNKNIENLNLPNDISDIPTSSKYSSHEGLQAALQTFRRGRSHKNAYILVLGSTNSGKSSTINLLFGDKNLTNVRNTNSTIRDVREYRIPVPIYELGLLNTELRVIDTPGLGYVNATISDAQSLAALDAYLTSHEELNYRIPNIVLIVHPFNDTTLEGNEAKSQFTTMLRGFDKFRDRITDKHFSNIIFVLTYFCSASKSDQRQPNNRILKFEELIKDHTSFPSPINIIIAENHGYEAELPMLKGNYELPIDQSQLYPRNLYDKIQAITNSSGDGIGQRVFRAAFDDPENLTVSKEVIGSVPNDYKEEDKHNTQKDFSDSDEGNNWDIDYIFQKLTQLAKILNDIKSAIESIVKMIKEYQL